MTFGLIFIIVFCLLSIISVLPWFISVKYKNFDVFEPIKFASIFMVLKVISIITVYSRGTFSTARVDGVMSTPFEEAMVIIVVFYFTFYTSTLFGYYLTSPNPKYIKRISSYFPSNSQTDSRKLRFLSFFYICIGAFSFWMIVRSAYSGNPLLIMTTSTPRSELFADASHWNLGANMLYLGYLLWISVTLSEHKSPSILQLVLLIPILVHAFLLGQRGTLVYILVIFVVMIYYTNSYGISHVKKRYIHLKKTKSNNIVALISVFTGGLVLIYAMAVSRYLRFGWSLERAVSNVSFLDVISIRESNLPYLVILTEQVPDQIGYYYGSYFIRPFINFIPRAVWEDKPVMALGGILRRAVFPETSGGTPPGVIGDWYVNFGYVGIIIGGVLWGLTMRYIYEFLKHNKDSAVALFTYSIAFTFLTIMSIHNNSIWRLITNLMFIIPIIVIHQRSGHG